MRVIPGWETASEGDTRGWYLAERLVVKETHASDTWLRDWSWRKHTRVIPGWEIGREGDTCGWYLADRLLVKETHVGDTWLRDWSWRRRMRVIPGWETASEGDTRGWYLAERLVVKETHVGDTWLRDWSWRRHSRQWAWVARSRSCRSTESVHGRLHQTHRHHHRRRSHRCWTLQSCSTAQRIIRTTCRLWETSIMSLSLSHHCFNGHFLPYPASLWCYSSTYPVWRTFGGEGGIWHSFRQAGWSSYHPTNSVRSTAGNCIY